MPSDPLTLGFDTAASSCGAVLLCGDKVLADAYEEMTKGQAERIMPMLEECLAHAGVGWRDLDRIGVGVGPGNFTGIRIAVSAARGLALGLGIPAIGVSNLESLALGTEGLVVTSLDARRGSVYLQIHAKDGKTGPCRTALAELPEIVEGGTPTCIGFAAEEIAAHYGGQRAPAKYYPASGIAQIAAKAVVRPNERPAPLYLRGADAAPPRDAPPTILA